MSVVTFHLRMQDPETPMYNSDDGEDSTPQPGIGDDGDEDDEDSPIV